MDRLFLISQIDDRTSLHRPIKPASLAPASSSWRSTEPVGKPRRRCADFGSFTKGEFWSVREDKFALSRGEMLFLSYICTLDTVNTNIVSRLTRVIIGFTRLLEALEAITLSREDGNREDTLRQAR
jgi:hypothetical protein